MGRATAAGLRVQRATPPAAPSAPRSWPRGQANAGVRRMAHLGGGDGVEEDGGGLAEDDVSVAGVGQRAVLVVLFRAGA